MSLISLDPGIRGCGVALFRGGRLEACDYLKNPVLKGDDVDAVLGMADEVVKWRRLHCPLVVPEFVFEHPRVYTISKSKGDPNDLMPLVGVAYACAGYIAGHKSVRVFPATWKGQLTKEACEARIRSRLDTAELAVLDATVHRVGAKAHNAVDAVGIGLHAVGRFAPKRSWEK